MDDIIVQFLTLAANDLKTLTNDVSRLTMNKKEELKSQQASEANQSDKSQKLTSKGSRNMKSLQRITTLRKSVEEVKFAAENPDLIFIKDQLEKIIDR